MNIMMTMLSVLKILFKSFNFKNRYWKLTKVMNIVKMNSFVVKIKNFNLKKQVIVSRIIK